jgi:hypothetical protein
MNDAITTIHFRPNLTTEEENGFPFYKNAGQVTIQ